MRAFEGFEKGVNLGGWVSQCGEGNYTKEHFDSFITEKDIQRIASWGLDHVRLPIDFHLFQNDDKSFTESGFGYIDKCLEWCDVYGLNTVLDLHKTMGFIFDDSSYCAFFEDESLQDNFVVVWEELTRRYAKYSDRVAFELLNEITMPWMAQKWNEIAKRTIKAIREINKDIRIIIGGIYNSSIEGLKLLDAPYDENIVFTFHCYSPLVFTHQSAYWVDNMPRDYKTDYKIPVNEMAKKSYGFFGEDYAHDFYDSDEPMNSRFFERLFAQAVEIAEKHNVPLYCGEYGVIDKADPEQTVKWFEDISSALRSLGIARACWNYKEKDFGLVDKHYAPVLNKLIRLL